MAVIFYVASLRQKSTKTNLLLQIAIVHFCLPKNEHKKYSLSLVPLTAECPKFIPPCGVLRRIVYPLFIVLLGCMKWQAQILKLF
jgi:hypothetical protein